MKEARHVATGRIVRASEAVHSDYMGIFECPTCKAALTLRQEYQRASGATIGAAFIHPSGGTEYQRNCPQRIHLTISKESSIDTMPNSKQQFGELLRKNLIQCLKQNCRDGAIQFYSQYKSSSLIEIKRLKAFFLLSNRWIKLPQNGRYISIDQANLIRDRVLEMQQAHSNLLGSQFSWSQERNSQETNSRCNQIIWGLEFIVNEKRDKFRKDVLNYVFGYYVFKERLKLVEMNEDRKFKVLGLGEKTLHASLEVVDNQELVKEFFVQLYGNNGKFSGAYEDAFRRAYKFHDLVFHYLIDYFIYFNWESLLYM